MPKFSFCDKASHPSSLHRSGLICSVNVLYAGPLTFPAFSAASGCCLVAFRLKTTLFFFPRCKMMVCSRASINHPRWSVGDRVTFTRECLSWMQEDTGRGQTGGVESLLPQICWSMLSYHGSNGKITLHGFILLYQTVRISQGWTESAPVFPQASFVSKVQQHKQAN